ncbi:unnamed protein product [Linum trigynum]
MDEPAEADDEPEEDPNEPIEEATGETTGENDASVLDHFAAALAYAEEGFQVAAAAAEIAGRLVDYSYDDDFGSDDD